MRRSWQCFAVAVLATPWCCAAALAQITLDGGEVQVTMTTAASAYQGAPVVAWQPDGNYIIAWQQQSVTTGGWDIFAQQFEPNGNAPPMAVGPAFQVSSLGTTSCRQSPAVATDAAGDFVIVWTSDEESGGLRGIFGQLYSSTGQPQGSRISVSTTATYDDLAPAVAMTADGRFLVAWQANGPSGWTILARAFQVGGTQPSNEIAVNVTAGGARHSPAVAYLPASAAEPAERYEIVWQAEGQDGPGPGASGIVGRAFDDSGNAQSGEMAINLPATGAHAHPRIASDPSGNFVVAWESLTAGGSVVLVRRFSAAGTDLSSGQLMVDSSPTGPEHDPVVAANALGQFVVVFDAAGQDGSGAAVVAQAFDSNSNQPQTLGGKVRLNSTTAGDQAFPGVGLSAGGTLLLAWQSQTPAADAAVITARGASLPALNFYTLAPCRVVDTRNANGPLGGPVMSAGRVRSFPVLSSASGCAIPMTARALSVNVTVVPVSGAGFARLFPGDAAPPPTSTVDFPASVVRANNGVFGLSRAGDGSLAVLVNAGGGTGQAHVIIDVNGYFQ